VRGLLPCPAPELLIITMPYQACPGGMCKAFPLHMHKFLPSLAEPGELPRRALCTMSDLDASNPASCGPCMAEFKGFVPGGSACCEAENLAVCPRAWE